MTTSVLNCEDPGQTWVVTAHGTIMLPSGNVSVCVGGSLEGLRVKFKGLWKCEWRESGTGETFRIPICNGGSCVYYLSKALIWLSVEGTSLLFGSEYCR